VLVVLLHIPAVQRFIGSQVSEVLAEKLGTKVEIGNIDLGMLNRIIIDDVLIKDQNDKDMLRAPRLSAKVGISDFFKGKITVSSAQIFGLKANLYKRNAFDKPNFQFVIDSLASKDTTKQTKLILEISSLIIRRGEIAYNQLDDYNKSMLSAKHINIHDISAHIILNKLTNDSIDLNIMKVALKDKSGFELKNLALKFTASTNSATLSDFHFGLKNSSLKIPLLTAQYEIENKNIKAGSLSFNGKINQSNIIPSDLGAFVKILSNYNSPISLSSDISGTDNDIVFSNLSISQGDDLSLEASGKISNIGKANNWNVIIDRLSTSSAGLQSIASNLGKKDAIPSVVERLGHINFSGSVQKNCSSAKFDGKLLTDIGNSTIKINKVDNIAKADIIADNLDLQKLTTNNDLGLLSGKISATGNVDGFKVKSAKGNADISSFAYKAHTYNNIKATADYVVGKDIFACINIVDNEGDINLQGKYNLASKTPKGSLEGSVSHLDPAKLGLTNKWEGSTFDFAVNCDFIGRDFDSALGHISITNLTKHTGSETFTVNSINLRKFVDGNKHELLLVSDDITLRTEGDFSYATLANSITNAVYDRLPTIPGLKKKQSTHNKFNVYGTINNTEWVSQFLGVDLRLFEPAHIIANVDDSKKQVNLTLDAAQFVFKGKEYTDGYVHIHCPNDTMKAVINAKSLNVNGSSSYNINAQAVDNNLSTRLRFSINNKQTIKGELNADAKFYTNEEDKSTADVRILPSTAYVNDSIWNINPARIRYWAKNLEIEDFSVHHKDQHIAINGKATENPKDEIEVELKDVNVSYILGLVNFHSVEFAGNATGKAHARSLFSDPELDAKLKVENFTFENGLLGTLDVAAKWNISDGNINVDGVAIDGDHKTLVNGYISPKNKDINLHVNAYGTSLAFLETYTDTFMSDIDVHGWGEVDVVGPLKEIQLVGKAKIEGKAHLISLNTDYYLRGDSVWLRPDDIYFTNDSIYDRDGHLGIVSGHLRHKHLGRFTFDIDVDAHNLLAYDTHQFGEDTFYGTAYCTGTASIRGKSGEIVIDVDATPDEGTIVVYNAASPDGLTTHDFLTFHDRNEQFTFNDNKAATDPSAKEFKNYMASNLYLNFLIHANPKATLKLIMDQNSGDYISLNGDGVIRASYYNKGSFDLFGNYIVDHGIYKLTIQNVINRDFEFLQGGTIAFGGDAYNAALNLKAQYTVNGVSLSDINIGKSFSNNNIRVNCLMDITGTPNQPHVDFSLEMPTVSAEAQQMVKSLMNSEEEMKQQVVYLLAIGRFFNQGANNSFAESSSQSQTSLAMQSLLSGTISSELSSILSNVVKNDDWSFGANISTGNEGFYNAEYEGLVSGRLLNNRLLINGQFGYRDNQTTNSTFIGDFDIRYLLVPSGNMAIKVYNQTNDKYFTKNSLNTQGVGLILKRDFNSWRDFIRFRKRK